MCCWFATASTKNTKAAIFSMLKSYLKLTYYPSEMKLAMDIKYN